MARRPGTDRTAETWAWNNSPGKRRASLKHRYGITPEQWQEMFEAQGGKCALCPNTGRAYRLCVDHNHETGQVRGLLCQRCNTAISREETFPGWLERVAAYLRGGDALVDA